MTRPIVAKSNRRHIIAAAMIVAGVVMLMAQPEDMPMQPGKAMPTPMLSKLIAVIRPLGTHSVTGTVVFEKVDDGVKVTARVGGLKPNERHGFHIHEFGDLGSEDAMSAGEHFNPDGNPHGMPESDSCHAGDLGNLKGDSEGNASLIMTVKYLNLGAGSHGILGRAVIVHANPDNGSQPSGNAGERIGAGVIGISKDATDSKSHMAPESNNTPGPGSVQPAQ